MKFRVAVVKTVVLKKKSEVEAAWKDSGIVLRKLVHGSNDGTNCMFVQQMRFGSSSL